MFATDPSVNNLNDILIRWGVGVAIFLSTTVLSFLIGRAIGSWRARQQWHQKQFLGRINIGINSLRDNSLRIRTIMERSLEEVFLNPVAVEKVAQAARRTKPGAPLLPIAREDRWFLLSFVLNAVAEHFSPGVIRQDAGQPVQTIAYLVFLTSELEGDDRIHKVRALMVQESVLINFPVPEGQMPKLEVDYHKDRVETLRQAASIYRTDPDLFIRLEVCV